jgi:hypothetical protein
LGGFIQFDFDAAKDDARLLTGPNLQDTFLVRRAAQHDGQLFKWIGFKMEGDYGTQQNPRAQDLESYAHSAATCTGAMPQISSAY